MGRLFDIFVLIFCNSTASRLIYAHSHYNMCAGCGYMYQIKQLSNGNVEFPIVKDTTPNMMNPRLYTTSYNKPQGQQFDDTAVLSFIKLQYT